MSWLLVGSIPGVLIGSRVSVGLPETVLRMALAAALALSGLKLLDVPYANEIVVVSLSVGLGALLVWGSSFSSGAAAGSSRRSRSPPTALMSLRAASDTQCRRPSDHAPDRPTSPPRPARRPPRDGWFLAPGASAELDGGTTPRQSLSTTSSTRPGNPRRRKRPRQRPRPRWRDAHDRGLQPGHRGHGCVRGHRLLLHAQRPGFRRDRLVHLHRLGRQRRDGRGVVLVSVTYTNEQPVASDDFLTTAEDTPGNVDVLANDEDEDGDQLTVVTEAPRPTTAPSPARRRGSAPTRPSLTSTAPTRSPTRSRTGREATTPARSRSPSRR